MQNCKILCAAHYVPEFIVTNEDLRDIVDTSDEWILSRTGIQTRHISTGENTSDLSTKVFNDLMQKSGLSPLDIDLIIVATISPDYMTPSTACIVQKNAGAKNAFAFDLNAACSGFIFALSTAAKFIMSGMYKTAVVIGADILSKLIDWSDRSTCVLFGDGAGGVILSASESGIYAESLHSDGEKGTALTAGHLPVDNAFFHADNKDQYYLQMNGREVFDFTLREVPGCITGLLEANGLTPDDIRYFVPHQANARMVSALAKKLKIDMAKFFVNINQYGNTTAATIPIVLSEMLAAELVDTGDKIILIGFGGGLTWGAILLEI